MPDKPKTVELSGDQLAFLRACLEFVALRVRSQPDDPELAALRHGPAEHELTMIAAIESALADAADFG